MLLYVFNGLVFLLLGLQLHERARAHRRANRGRGLAGYALVLCVGDHAGARRLGLSGHLPAAPALAAASASARAGAIRARCSSSAGRGLRGSVTMAAALSIPLVTATGAPFPGRDLILFLAGDDDRAHARDQRPHAAAVHPRARRARRRHRRARGTRGAHRRRRRPPPTRVRVEIAEAHAPRGNRLRRAADRRLRDAAAPPFRERPRGATTSSMSPAAERRAEARRAGGRARRAPFAARHARHQRARRCAPSRPRSTTPKRSSRAFRGPAIERIGRDRAAAMTDPHSRCFSAARSTRSTTGISSSRARCARALDLAAVRLVPAGDPPHRGAPRRLGRASPRDGRGSRVADYPGLEVDDREIARAGPELHGR